MPSTLDLKRGDVVRVRLDPILGSEQAGERPALVLSPDFINERSPVVLIAAITSKKTERVYPFEALIEPPAVLLLVPGTYSRPSLPPKTIFSIARS